MMRRFLCAIVLVLPVLLMDAGAARARTPTERELSLFKQGNAAYQASNYEAAVQAYETLLKSGLESRDVYYNLGNAWLKQGRLGPAILNYRKALRIDPTDEDARANLSYARARTQDTTPQEAPDPFPWLTAIRPGPDKAGFFFLLAFNVMALIFAGRHVVRRPPPVMAPLFVVALTFTVLTALGFYFEAQAGKESPGGVVTAEQADVRSGPGGDYTVAFVVHEGTEVQIGRIASGWTEITVTSELKGWVNNSAVERIE